MSDRKILIETVSFKPLILTEEKRKNGRKVLVFEGIFGACDVINKNNRLYTKEETLREINNLQPVIKERRLMGELDHPEERLSVNLDSVSHLIVGLWLEGNNVLGRGEILPTDKGMKLEALLKAEVTIGLSSRASGELIALEGEYGQLGTQQVSDFQLETYDAVADASAPGAQITRLIENIKRRQKLVNRETPFYSEDEYKRLVDHIVNEYLKSI